MCYCEGEPAEFQTEWTPVARVERDCHECGGVIRKGERYVRLAGKWEGEFDTHVRCGDCDAWSKAFVVAMRRECGSACWTLRSLWGDIAEFCREHLFYDPKTGREYERPRTLERSVVMGES